MLALDVSVIWMVSFSFMPKRSQGARGKQHPGPTTRSISEQANQRCGADVTNDKWARPNEELLPNLANPK